MITTYVINLKDSFEKRDYINRQFSRYKDIFHIKWVEAVDGRNLTDSQIRSIFNQDKAYKNYGRYLKGGEVGCALSHRKCCRELLNSGEDVALFVEDDVVWQKEDIGKTIESIRDFMSVDRPIIVLLSGDYWFTSTFKLDNDIQLARVREAVCTHAYMINRRAAEIILSTEKCFLADDWFSITNSRIKLYGLRPHIADQNRRDLKTEISTDYTGLMRKNQSVKKWIQSYYRGAIKHILYYTRHFEYKDFLV